MNKLTYAFYTSRLWTFLLRLTGRVPAGFYVGPRNHMMLKDAQACVGPGWSGLVKEGFDLCLRRGARIHQIKEKFGGLRFYCDIEWRLEENKLEERSLSICEECGRPGEPRGGGWTKTLCDSCDEPITARKELAMKHSGEQVLAVGVTNDARSAPDDLRDMSDLAEADADRCTVCGLPGGARGAHNCLPGCWFGGEGWEWDKDIRALRRALRGETNA